MVNIRVWIDRLWAASAVLTATSVLMLAALFAFVIGLVVDPREIGGAPAWMKPAKFAISTAIFSGTIAWFYCHLTVWPAFRRKMAWVISVVVIVEVAIIAVQAGRGTTSHFNFATVLDGALFTIMGTSIVILWFASIGVLAATFRQRFEDPAWGWWLRWGLLITVVGAAAGGMMLRRTPEQQRMAASGQRLAIAGAHTVGAPDGGTGLPVTGWSTEHGDLRIPHFIALHGAQVLPFLGWFLRRRHTGRRYAAIAGLSYLSLTSILTSQALRGQPLIAPDSITLTALTLWLTGTAAAVVIARLLQRPAAALHPGGIAA